MGFPRLCILTAAALALLAQGADAAQRRAKAKPKPKPAVARTYAFDGRYSGIMKVTPQLSRPDCRDIPVENFVINAGTIEPATTAPTLRPVFDGFVTEEGFISGHMRVGDSVVPFEGRAAPMGMVKVISGGVMDDAAGCSWVVNLTLE